MKFRPSRIEVHGRSSAAGRTREFSWNDYRPDRYAASLPPPRTRGRERFCGDTRRRGSRGRVRGTRHGPCGQCSRYIPRRDRESIGELLSGVAPESLGRPEAGLIVPALEKRRPRRGGRCLPRRDAVRRAPARSVRLPSPNASWRCVAAIERPREGTRGWPSQR